MDKEDDTFLVEFYCIYGIKMDQFDDDDPCPPLEFNIYILYENEQHFEISENKLFYDCDELVNHFYNQRGHYNTYFKDKEKFKNISNELKSKLPSIMINTDIFKLYKIANNKYKYINSNQTFLIEDLK